MDHSVCAVAIKRTLLLKPLMTSTDYTWAAVEQFQWCFVEVNAGILCATVPALKPFFARYLPGLINSKLRSNDRSKNKEGYNNSGYNTIEKDSHQRSRTKKDLYELTVLDDDISSNKTMQTPIASDDETRLWSGTTRANASSNVGRPQVAHIHRPSLGRDSQGRRIYVTSETTVEFNER